MEISFLLGFAIMWVALIMARRASLKEIQLLDTDKKAELVDMASGRRGMQIAILVVGIAAFYIINLLIDSRRELYFGLYGLFIVGWIIFRNIQALKEYRNRGFSESFIKSQQLAAMIRLVGIIAFFVCVGLNFVLNK